MEQWYAVNFSNEQVLQGKSTIFLRFQNLTRNLGNGQERNIWILPICEVVNAATNLEENKNQIFFNGIDATDLEAVFKLPNNYTKIQNSESKYVLWSGGPSSGNIVNPEETFGEIIPNIQNIIPGNLQGNKISLESGQITNWIEVPVHSDDSNNRDFNEKQNYRIDYEGGKDIVLKIKFLITTKDPNNTEFIDSLPTINPNSGYEILGDVQLNGTEWEHYDGIGWESFSPPMISTNDDWPTYGIKHLIQEGYFQPNGDNLEWFDYQETYVFCYPKNTSVTSRNDYWIEKEVMENQITDDNSSFMLMRTNPKLSGNIKVVMDSSGNMFLDTIEANDELSNAKYKRKKINPQGSFPVDLKRIFSSLDPQILYDLKERDNQYLNSKRNFYEEYDFFYGYGASQLNSKYYEENYRLFAPIWIKKELPEFFGIFKVDGSINPETYADNNKEKLLTDLFKDAKIIKTFDLREGTAFGTYFNKLVKDSRYQESPIKISYEENVLSTWAGVSYKDGILANKGEYLYDFFQTDNTQHDFDEFITTGFERNRMISTNLINMEFLFNDPTSEDYEINRYFGVYFNENELAEFEIYSDFFSLISDQSPEPRKNIDGEPYSTQPFIQENPNGVVIPVDYIQGNGSVNEPEFIGDVKGKLPLPGSVEDPLRVFYLKDRDNNIQRIRSIVEYSFNSQGASNYTRFSGIELYKDKQDISKFSGISKLKAQLKSELLSAGNSQIVIDFKNTINDNRPIIEEGEFLEIELVDFNQDKQLWRMIANSTGLQPGDHWDFPLYNPDEYLYVNTFSPKGSVANVAQAFAGCVNSFDNRMFDAWASGDKVYLQVKESGDSGNSFTFCRKMIRNSIIDNLGFYDIAPIHCVNFIEDIQIIDITTTGDVTAFIETCELPRVNDYEIRVSNINGNFITFQIRRNGGLIDTVTYEISSSGNLTITYENNNISFSILLDPGVIYNINDSWTFIPEFTVIKQRFVGGSKRNRNRASLPKEEILNIVADDWFQSQKGFYSRLLMWEVQGKKIFKLPDLEDPIFNEKSTLSGFSKFATHEIIQLESSMFEFYQTNQRRIVSFDVFKPSLGIMSILPIKDFDFDFVLSDYAYTPSGEIDTYYETFNILSGEEKEIPLNQNFIVTSGTISLLGYDSVNDIWLPIEDSNDDEITFNVNENFNTYIPNYYYESNKENSDCLFDAQGGTNYFYRVYKKLSFLENNNISKLKLLASQDSVINYYTYDNDNDLKEFTGFLGLTDFISDSDISELENLIETANPERFFFGQLLSEYDRLRERFITDYAVKSKVVPFINKWVQRGTDCRDNKYRLNNSLAFGVNGFSPDIQIQDRNPILHTHEFFYIDEFPSNFSPELMENSRSYFYENISDKVVSVNDELKSWYELFQQNDNDWFSKYFTLGYPTELNQNTEKVRKKTEERYVFTKFIPGDESVQGLFRGGKFKIQDIDIATNTVIPSSKKYADYKFSAILRIKSLSTFSNEPPTDIEIISNEKFKTIVMIITLYVNDYRIQNGGYGFLFLYAGVNALRSTNQYNEVALFTDINNPLNPNSVSRILSDTQRHFNEFIGGGIIDYQDAKLNGIINTNITAGLNPRVLSSISNTPKSFVPVEEILPIDNSEYNKEVVFNSDGLISHPAIRSLEFGEFSEFSQMIPRASATNLRRYIINHQAPFSGNTAINENDITITGPFNLGYFTLGNINFSVGFPTRKLTNVPTINYSSQRNKDYSLWYLSGGKDYLAQRLSEVSFANVSERLNSNDPTVSYVTITDNTDIIRNDFKIEFISYDEISKTNTLSINEDTDKPNVYQESEIIGFELEDLPEGDVVFRHRGNYEPKTRKIFNFWARESQDITDHYNLDFLLGNTRIGIEYENFGVINNLYHMKVSDTEIMKISSESEYKSLYPLVEETAIDYKDYMVFNSNWDNFYFDKYENRFGVINESGETSPLKVEGTLELKEEKSFFGSKIMTTPRLYEFHTFNLELNEIDFEIIPGLSSTDVTQLLEDAPSTTGQNAKKDTLKISINSAERILNQMITDNLTLEFTRLRDLGITRFANLSDDELLEISKKYVQLNILNLFKVDEIILYVKDNADDSIDPVFRSDLSEANKRELGYLPTKDSDVIQVSNFQHEIKVNLDSKKFRSYSVFMKVVRI